MTKESDPLEAAKKASSSIRKISIDKVKAFSKLCESRSIYDRLCLDFDSSLLELFGIVSDLVKERDLLKENLEDSESLRRLADQSNDDLEESNKALRERVKEYESIRVNASGEFVDSQSIRKYLEENWKGCQVKRSESTLDLVKEIIQFQETDERELEEALEKLKALRLETLPFEELSNKAKALRCFMNSNFECWPNETDTFALARDIMSRLNKERDELKEEASEDAGGTLP